MKIQLSVNGSVIVTASLDGHASALDFAALLPLSLSFADYAATEKIADLPRTLSVADAPQAITPVAGDICFYAPWGNLAIFYKGGRLSKGLVLLGRLDSGVQVIEQLGSAVVRVERATA